MEDWRSQLANCFHLLSEDVATLLSQRDVLLADADVPSNFGVYLFLFEETIVYVGEAKGRGGLRDRILSKHISGDNSHAGQRFFSQRFPDRQRRREFIRKNVSVKWVVIDDPLRVAIVERMIIWLFNPSWNKK